MTKPDSTDAGGVTHEHDDSDMECPCCQCMLRSVRAGWRSGGKRLVELEAQLAEVTRDRDDHVDACAEVAAQRDEISAQLAAMTNRALKAEAALATLTREREHYKRLACKCIERGCSNKPLPNALQCFACAGANPCATCDGSGFVGYSWGSKDQCSECNGSGKTATPPAPLPGGQGPVTVAMLHQLFYDAPSDTFENFVCYIVNTLADRLERGGEGREG